ncbi:MAG: pilus assembly protein [Rhizobiaceae bacterium]|nr:pilus assembly protein [Rhizobiaceae bacterium]MCV0406860.1 pilus assembly protein [Rhizobiaceae bacterium]
MAREKLSARLARFWRNRRGNFAMMTTIASLPVLLSVATAVDVARILEYKTRMANAADAAVLAAIADGTPAREAAFNMPGIGPLPQGEQDVEAFFTANFLDEGKVSFDHVTADVRKENHRIVSSLTYRANVSLFFGGILNLDSVPISGKAQAAIQTNAAVDFYMLLDNTPSMGLAATTEGIKTLETHLGCAFACHATNGKDDTYHDAVDLGVALRIDVVREATQKLTARAEEVRTWLHQFRMAVFSFGKDATKLGLTQVAALSSNMDQVANATNDLKLMTIPKQGYDNDQQTDFQATFQALNALVPKPGSGLNGAEPQKVVFFVSDGVNDSYKPGTCTKPTTKGRCQEPINPAVCEAVKARGIKIAVLYTRYLPVPSNDWYMSWIAPFQGEISGRMKSCATPGLFFEVGPGEGIAEAMDALFIKAVQMLRLIG